MKQGSPSSRAKRTKFLSEHQAIVRRDVSNITSRWAVTRFKVGSLSPLKDPKLKSTVAYHERRRRERESYAKARNGECHIR
jgi:hypothetical protein